MPADGPPGPRAANVKLCEAEIPGKRTGRVSVRSRKRVFAQNEMKLSTREGLMAGFLVRSSLRNVSDQPSQRGRSDRAGCAALRVFKLEQQGSVN